MRVFMRGTEVIVGGITYTYGGVDFLAWSTLDAAGLVDINILLKSGWIEAKPVMPPVPMFLPNDIDMV